jgi:hypothetical protein
MHLSVVPIVVEVVPATTISVGIGDFLYLIITTPEPPSEPIGKLRVPPPPPPPLFANTVPLILAVVVPFAPPPLPPNQ